MMDVYFPGKKIKRFFPECWEELTTAQFLKIAGWIFELSQKKLTINTFYLLIMYDFLGIKQTAKNITWEICESFAKIEEQIKWIFNFDEKTGYQLNLNFTKNLISSFALDLKIYYGPADALGDVSFYEFLTAHAAYIQFHKTKDVRFLNTLAATLYRPISAVSSKRELFLQDTLLEREEIFNKMHFSIKYGIFLFFEAVMNALKEHDKYRYIFKQSSEGSDEGVGLVSVIYTFNERNLTNNLDYLYNTLDILYLDYLKNKEMEKALKK